MRNIILKSAKTLYKKCLPILAGLILLCLLFPLQTFAHAQYLRSNPAANTRFGSGQPPTRVQVWFSEEIEPSFSRLEVYDKNRQRVDQNDSHIVSDDPKSLIISLRAQLPDGAYTVVFHNVSREDGHAVTGNFSFVVGEGPLPTSNILPQNGALDDNFNIWSILIRWLNYLAVAGLIGSMAFWLLVGRPAFDQFSLQASNTKLLSQNMSKRALQVALGSVLLLLIGWIAFLCYQASIASGSAQIFTNGALVSLLARSRFGVVWIARLLFVLLAGLLCLLLYRQHRPSSKVAWLVLLIGLVIALTSSLNSHAASSKLAWMLVPMDLLHLAGMGFWIGGLFTFVLILPSAFKILVAGSGDRTRFLAALIPRFSQVALLSIVLLVVTGTLQAATQIESFDLLFNSPYGRALIVKVCVFLVLLAFGAYHLRKIGPRMRSFARDTDSEHGASSLAAGKLQRTFRKSLSYEALLAVLLLLAAGVLTSISPPQPAPSTTNGTLLRQGQMGDLTYRLAISPVTVGTNTFELEIKDAAGKPVEKADAVLARFTMLDMDMGMQELDFQPAANRPGYYTATSPVLSMAGRWRMTLIVRRAGHDDATISLEYTL
jgi:copper transport protein